MRNSWRCQFVASKPQECLLCKSVSGGKSEHKKWLLYAEFVPTRIGESRECVRQISCQFGFDFGNYKIRSTLWPRLPQPSDLTLATSSELFGNFAFFLLDDTIGRKASFFLCIIWFLVTGIVSAFMPSISSMIVVRSLHGIVIPAICTMPLALMLEFVSPNQHTWVNCLFARGYGIAEAFVGILGFLCKSYEFHT